MDIINDTDLTDSFFLDNFNNKQLSVLYFTASWCGPCKKIYPLVNEIIKKLTNQLFKFYIIDVDNNEKLSDKFKVNSVPTFILVNNEDIIDSFSGNDIYKFKELLKTGKEEHKKIFKS